MSAFSLGRAVASRRRRSYQLVLPGTRALLTQHLMSIAFSDHHERVVSLMLYLVSVIIWQLVESEGELGQLRARFCHSVVGFGAWRVQIVNFFDLELHLVIVVVEQG